MACHLMCIGASLMNWHRSKTRTGLIVLFQMSLASTDYFCCQLFYLIYTLTTHVVPYACLVLNLQVAETLP